MEDATVFAHTGFIIEYCIILKIGQLISSSGNAVRVIKEALSFMTEIQEID